MPPDTFETNSPLTLKNSVTVFLFNVRKQLSTFSVVFGSRISDRLQYHSLTRSAQKTNVFVFVSFATDERQIYSFKKN